MKKCIVIVSFGTVDLKGIKDNIERIEDDVKESFGEEYLILRAFTSNIIIKKLREEHNIDIFSINKALEYLNLNEYEEVIIQPLHIIPGKEYTKLEAVCKGFNDKFKRIKLSTPLLSGKRKDYRNLVKAIEEEISKDKTIVLVGHGTEHKYDCCYKELENEFINSNYDNVIIGTLESYPTAIDVIEILKKRDVQNVCIMPLLLTCGGHVKRDISGDKSLSWKNIFIDNKFNTEVMLKGLGEYKGIRKIFLNKLNEVINE